MPRPRKQDDLHQLLDSVLRGFPIGSILVWDTEEEVETADRVGPIEVGSRPAGSVGYLLDGQQPISTLVGTLRLPEGSETIVDDVDWHVYCDLENLNFHRVATTESEPQHFPVRSLLDTAGFFADSRRIVDEVKDKVRSDRWLEEADRLANAFRDYQLPVIHIREADLDSAVTVFARLNHTGRRMTADEMVSALTYREGQFHLAKKLDVTSDRLLPYGLQLVLLSEFFRLRLQPEATEIELLTRWFWVTSFTGWFGGVNTAQVVRALAEIRDLARGTALDSASLISMRRLNRFPSASMAEAPVFVPSCSTLHRFDRVPFAVRNALNPTNCSPHGVPGRWATCRPARVSSTVSSAVPRIGCSSMRTKLARHSRIWRS